MTILIDLTSLYFHLTGIERYAANMTKQMLDRHPESGYILVFANELPEMFREYKPQENIRMLVLPCRSRLCFNQVRLPVSLYRHKADVYFFPAFCAPWMFWGHAVVSTIHDMSDFECWRGKQRLKVLYSRLGIYHAKHSAKRILTVSEFSKNRICSILGIAREKVHIAYNGVCGDKTCQYGLICLKCNPKACTQTQKHVLITIDEFYHNFFKNLPNLIDFKQLKKFLETGLIVQKKQLNLQ